MKQSKPEGFEDHTRHGKHIGFHAAQADIQRKEGVSKESAGAILAAGARNASKAAKKANPHLKRVKGK